MRVVAVIPARLGSTRLPRKVLADLGGRPLVQRVVERVREAGRVHEVVVATDADEVEAALAAYGTPVVRTGPCRSGTDRVAEAARALRADAFLNVQGDEPFVDAGLLDALVEALDGASMATACTPIDDVADFLDADIVKVVPDARGDALAFSRAPIPWPRDAELGRAGPLPDGVRAWRHLGIYAFTADALRAFAELPPHPLELQEQLEPLRPLAWGLRIALVQVDSAGPSVDTPADLERARALWVERGDG